jgi:BMFP domain-containing protein YqiC
MTQQSTLLDDGFDRIQAAFRSVEDEVQKAQKRFESRSQKFSTDANKRIKSFQKELRKYPAVQQAESFQKDLSEQFQARSKQVEKQIENSIGSVLGTLQIASRGEINKLDKKLNRINRRLKALDKAIDSAAAKVTPAKRAGGASSENAA